MIHIKRNGRGFIASAALECVGAMLAHNRTATPIITPAKPMPKVTIKGVEPPFEETLMQYWLAQQHRKVRRSLFV